MDLGNPQAVAHRVEWDRTEALAREVRALRRRNAELEQFTYIVSHDLKEPLRMVSTYLALLDRESKGKLGEAAADHLHYALDGAKRMTGLVEDLERYTRIMGERPAIGSVSAAAACDAALANLGLAIEETGAQIEVGNLPPVHADRTQLVLLFQNLIGNAVKFVDGVSPSVTIAATPDGPYWLFSVRDNGIGIPSDDSERIFTVFQRLHDRERYPGTGVGLTICRAIVERHGGRIWAESVPGQGATFYFTLPRRA